MCLSCARPFGRRVRSSGEEECTPLPLSPSLHLLSLTHTHAPDAADPPTPSLPASGNIPPTRAERPPGGGVRDGKEERSLGHNRRVGRVSLFTRTHAARSHTHALALPLPPPPLCRRLALLNWTVAWAPPPSGRPLPLPAPNSHRAAGPASPHLRAVRGRPCLRAGAWCGHGEWRWGAAGRLRTR